MAPPPTHRQWKYDVFLSFRGDDIRRNFLDHLYATLRQKGVHAFKDDKELERGKDIRDEIQQAIKNSRFCIIVFSKTYADSTWCLDELVTIYDCVTEGKVTAIPIFYGVDPFDVQTLKCDYEEAFKEHEKTYRDEVIKKWKVAIRCLANLCGWSLQNRHEVQFITDIVENILGQLRKFREKIPTYIENGPIGIEKHLLQLDLYTREKPNDVCIVGICGMGGIGKTTIAKAFFDKMSNQFQRSAFLESVREEEEKHGLIRLQEQLLNETVQERSLRIWNTYKGIDEIHNRLSHEKVLVVLDDVSSLEQLKSLAGKSSWFGCGSRIIITTRNEHLLRFYGECMIYRVPELDANDALQLFYLKAFRNVSPIKAYKDLSYDFLRYCSGLPLAIDVLGSFLYGLNSTKEWESALQKLKAIPHKNILDKLKISFEALDEIEQKIFLDITCFFKGKDQNHVKRILESCDFYSDIGMRVLMDKSLITINSFNEVCMHDLLQQMGREIVRQQCPEEPGKRSRLWHCKDVYHVLLHNTGTNLVEGIMIEDSYEQKYQWSAVEALSAKAFSKMKRLRLLKLQYLNIDRGFEFLANNLRYLDWYEFPLKSLLIDFQLSNTVELHLRYSNIKLLWKGIKPLKMLKVLDLCHSKKLVRTPNFKEVPKLEKLNLEGCTRLLELDNSIGLLKELVFLNLKGCTSLIILPNAICNVKSLKILNLSGCLRLTSLPERFGQLTNLEILNLSKEGNLGQSSMKPWHCFLPWKRSSISMLLTLPSSLASLSSLTILNLSYCHLKGGIPNDLSSLCLLELLDLSGNDFDAIPDSINQLSKLELLLLANCGKLEVMPELPSNVWFLRLSNCHSLGAPSSNFENKRKLLHVEIGKLFKLINNQQKPMMASESFASYLHNLQTLKHNGQEILPTSTYEGVDVLDATFCVGMPDGRTPGLLFYQTFGNSITVIPPPNWCNEQCLGFYVTTILYPRQNSTIDQIDPSYLRTMYIKIDGHYYSGFSSCGVDQEDRSIQILQYFIPLSLGGVYNWTMDWWNKVSNIEIECKFVQTKFKNLGFKFCIIYKQDVQKLLEINSSFVSKKSLTICEEDCSDGGQKSTERGSSTGMDAVIPHRRLRDAEVDEELKWIIFFENAV